MSFFLAIFAYPVLVVLRLLWILLLEAVKVPQLAQPLAPIENVPMFLVAVVAVSLLPGFSEELVFRGIMMERFRTKVSVAKAIIISALFFIADACRYFRVDIHFCGGRGAGHNISHYGFALGHL